MNDSDNKKKICLTKADLADAVFAYLSLDKIKANDVVQDFIELIKDGLVNDGKVMLSGFGSFEVNTKKPRVGRNPQTGEPIILKARKVVKFKSSQILRKAVNSDNTPVTESDEY